MSNDKSKEQVYEFKDLERGEYSANYWNVLRRYQAKHTAKGLSPYKFERQLISYQARDRFVEWLKAARFLDDDLRPIVPVHSWCHIYAAYVAVNEMVWDDQQEQLWDSHTFGYGPYAVTVNPTAKLGWGYWSDLLCNGPWTQTLKKKLWMFREFVSGDPAESHKHYVEEMRGRQFVLDERVRKWLGLEVETSDALSFSHKMQYGFYKGVIAELDRRVTKGEEKNDEDRLWEIYEMDLCELDLRSLRKIVTEFPPDEHLVPKWMKYGEVERVVHLWMRARFWLRAMALKVWAGMRSPRWKGYENALAFLSQAAVVNGLVWRGCYGVYSRFLRSPEVSW